MVHADVLVAGLAELVDRQSQQVQLGFRRRQVFGVDPVLGLEQVGQVGVAVDRQPVRTRFQGDVQGAREALQGLLGQAVDQVHVDRAEAVFAAGLDDAQGLLHALDAVHRLLHHRIEILHAQAGAVEAGLAQLAHFGRGDEARIQLDRAVHLRAAGEGEVPAQHVHHLGDLLRVQEVGRATAEVHLLDLAVAVEHRGGQRDLAVQPGQVGLPARLVAGDDAVAAAVEARAGAERDVQIQRNRARDRIAIAGRGHLAQLRLAEPGRELRRGRVRGIARPRHVVALEQLRIEQGGQGSHGVQARTIRWCCP